MVRCARCEQEVTEVQAVTPDVITSELVDSVNDRPEDTAGEGEIAVCAACLAELKEN